MLNALWLVMAANVAEPPPHHPNDRADVPSQSSTTALPANRVTISEEGDERVVRSNGIPDHAPGAFPRRGNPNSIRPQQHVYRMPLHPVANEGFTPMRGPFGVALNGVPFDPGTAEFWSPQGRSHDRSSGWNYDALSGRINLGIDEHHAHVQPTGAYHYHGVPTGLVDARTRATTDLDHGHDHPHGDAHVAAHRDTPPMALVGYAADGFPIYVIDGVRPSYRLKAGQRPGGENAPGGAHDGTFVQDWEFVPGLGDLDQANGRVGPTPEFPDGTYHYVITDEFPNIPRMFRGTPDSSFRHGRRGERGERRGPGGRSGDGRPPRRGRRPGPPGRGSP